MDPPKSTENYCPHLYNFHIIDTDFPLLKEYTLLPDNAAIVVAELNLDDILSRESTCMLNIFLLYDVCTSSGSTREHQLSLETITIDTDVLHDKRFAVQFEANDCTCLTKRSLTLVFT